MEIQEAVKTIRALADGLDPITGEIFPEDSPYQRSQVVRALTIALQKMEGSQQTPGITVPAASSVPLGAPWSDEEDERLCQAFYNMVAFDEIASAHGRTRPAIISRLITLGKIKPKGQQAA